MLASADGVNNHCIFFPSVFYTYTVIEALNTHIGNHQSIKQKSEHFNAREYNHSNTNCNSFKMVQNLEFISQVCRIALCVYLQHLLVGLFEVTNWYCCITTQACLQDCIMDKNVLLLDQSKWRQLIVGKHFTRTTVSPLSALSTLTHEPLLYYLCLNHVYTPRAQCFDTVVNIHNPFTFCHVQHYIQDNVAACPSSSCTVKTKI